MLNFRLNIRLNFRIVLAVLWVCSIGCTKPEKQDPALKEGGVAADFRVDSGKATGFGDAILTGDSWQKPLSATFQFSVCLKDRARDTEILNSEFRIEDPHSKLRLDSVKTNPKGCLVWTEPIAFNYFVKRSRWITIERDIVGVGVHRGRRKVTYAINPWLASGRKEISPADAAYFLRDDPLEIKDPQDRIRKIYEFFKQTLLGKTGGSLSPSDQAQLDSWRASLEEGTEGGQSILTPSAESVRALAGDDEGNAQIWVNEINLLSLKTQNISVDETLADSEKGYLVQQTITMKPRLRVRMANGAETFETVEKGEFDVYVQVVATHTGFDQTKKLILSESLKRTNAAHLDEKSVPSGMGKVVDGQLLAFVNFKINKQVAEGNVDLVIKLVPKRIGNRAPKPFEGIFNMGRVKSWVGGSTSALIAQNCVPGLGTAAGCSYDGYLGQTSQFASMKAALEATSAEPYQFTNIKARFVQVDMGDVTADDSGSLNVSTGETATRRTVLYSASTCVTDQNGDRLSRQKFVIRYLDVGDSGSNLKPIEKLTDDTGCILWNNTITHGYYKPEKYFRQVISIEGPGGAKRIKTIYVNPWDDKFTFSFDEEELGKEFFDKIAKRPRIASIFYLGDYSYHTVRFLYEIDPFMDLEVKKTVLMDVEPMVLRYSGIISGRKVTEHLRDGIYLMKVAIQKSYLDPADRFQRLCEADRARLETDSDGKVTERWERVTVADPQLCLLSRTQRRITVDDQKSTARALPTLGIDKFQNAVIPKDFITTKTTLIRVTDGLVIQPVELAMKDLRLMRIRSNFLIQLEAVDERKILFNEQLSQEYRRLLAQSLREHRMTSEEFRKQTLAQLRDEEVERDRNAKDKILVLAAEKRRDYYRHLYREELKRLDRDKQGNIVEDFNRSDGDLKKLLERFDQVKNPIEDLRDNDPKVQDDIRRLYERYSIYKKMAQNDFTKISLPDCDKIDCNEFIEADSGLKPRTFVGPVIFLSNSYKDAMRATDNLDEARCHEEIPGVDYQPEKLDPFETTLRKFEETLWNNNFLEQKFVRPNNAYRYNKYFGSLRQFCVRPVPGTEGQAKAEFYPKQVDDLIGEEKALKGAHKNNMQAMATPFNFTSIYNLDFYSFGGEKLKRLDEGRVRAGCQLQGLESCMTETTEHTLETLGLLDMAHRRLKDRLSYAHQHWVTWTPWASLTKKKNFTVSDLQQSVFSSDFSPESTIPICGILASQLGENYLTQLKDGTAAEQLTLENIVFRECIAQGKEGFFRDRKLRIYSTGDYAFMGGMQLNFNVTYGFGVSRSQSHSAGLDYLDIGKQTVGALGMVGAPILAGTALAGPVGAVVGGGVGLGLWAIKPFDLKRSWSMGGSSGTSVSEQTYLVGQIAKFSIPLKEWEQCNVIRMHPKTVQVIAEMFNRRLRYGVGTERELFHRVVGVNPASEINEAVKERINQIFGRGLFVCDGIRRTKDVGSDGVETLGKNIDELYFYFTQHFTEGDMLDQADLYNNPWLLSLRGKRDFSAFVQLIRGQEVVNLTSFVDGLLNDRPKPSENPGWALEHMANIYKAILPSFPGLYTVLDEGEGMDFFPLKSKSFLHRDLDINQEIKRGGGGAERGRVTGRQ